MDVIYTSARTQLQGLLKCSNGTLLIAHLTSPPNIRSEEEGTLDSSYSLPASPGHSLPVFVNKIVSSKAPAIEGCFPKT